jgi:hypothetical protein
MRRSILSSEFQTIQLLYAWEESFCAGDNHRNDWALQVLCDTEDNIEVPYVHHVPNSAKAFLFIIANGVDITKTDRNGYTILFEDKYDEETYRCIAEEFYRKKLIDKPSKTGMTALSAHIKRKNLPTARILLSLGASPYSVAIIERYGNSKLDVVQQAVYGDEADCIRALELLKEFGLKISKDRKSALIEYATSLNETSLANYISSMY